MLYAILCTDGMMKIKELHECQENSWVPIAVEKVDDKIYIPLFKVKDLAKRFKHRNLPKEWPTGVITVYKNHIEQFQKQGYIPYIMEFPHKTRLQTEVIEFEVNLEFVGKS